MLRIVLLLVAMLAATGVRAEDVAVSTPAATPSSPQSQAKPDMPPTVFLHKPPSSGDGSGSARGTATDDRGLSSFVLQICQFGTKEWIDVKRVKRLKNPFPFDIPLPKGLEGDFIARVEVSDGTTTVLSNTVFYKLPAVGDLNTKKKGRRRR